MGLGQANDCGGKGGARNFEREEQRAKSEQGNTSGNAVIHFTPPYIKLITPSFD